MTNKIYVFTLHSTMLRSTKSTTIKVACHVSHELDIRYMAHDGKDWQVIAYRLMNVQAV
jgi:hypothetical protein